MHQTTAVRRVELPERASVGGLREKLMLVGSPDFLVGALRGERQTSVKQLLSFVVTPLCRADIAMLSRSFFFVGLLPHLIVVEPVLKRLEI